MSNKKLFFLVFFCVLIPNLLNTNVTSWDTRWTIHTAYSLISEGDLDLDEYADYLKKNDNYGIWKERDHIYYFFPIGVSIISVPFVFIAEYIYELILVVNPEIKTKLAAQGITLFNVSNYYYILEYFIASIIVSICAGMCFLICRKYLSIRDALIITFVFAFCTSLWSIAGRALWMHGPLILFLLIVIYMLISENLNVKKVIWMGLLMAFCYTIRPTGIVFFGVFLVYFLFTNRKFASIYFLSGAAIFAWFFILNYSLYNNILPPYYQFYADIINGNGYPNFFEALAGNMISPGKGLLIFSPIFVFSAIGVYMKIKMKDFSIMDFFFILLFLGYYISIAVVTKWWSGWSYGPRYISDTLPVLIYFLIPYFKYPEFFKKTSRKVLNYVFIVLVIASLYIHTRAAISFRVWNDWNGVPNDIDYHPERIWDWKDPPFLR